MQRKAILIGLGLLWSIIIGCGSTDLLDEVGQRYTAMISIQDLDNETLSIDVIQSYCDSDVEDYGPVTASVEFAVGAAPGITLQNYTLEYFPLESADGTGVLVMPPDLESPINGGNLGIDISSGGSASFEITCLSVDTKEEYRIEVGWIYNTEISAGQALITAKQAEIDALEADIFQLRLDIIAAEQNGDPTEAMELVLEGYEADLEELELEYNQLYYGFYTIPELQEARYLIRITFNFEDEYGVSRTIVRERTVWLGNYDNC
jgi:hypothetical protein